MDEDSKEKLKDILSAIDPVEFAWTEATSTVGVIAQDISTVTLNNSFDTTIGPISLANLGNITMSSNYNWASGSSISAGSSQSFHADTTEYGKNTIKTPRSTIDIDELADMMETVKRRLLILTPKFEMHEKYPMLKEMYNEYKAMEKLLSGPDSSEEK